MKRIHRKLFAFVLAASFIPGATVAQTEKAEKPKEEVATFY